MQQKFARYAAVLPMTALLLAVPCYADETSETPVLEYDDMGMYTVNDSYITFGYAEGGGVIITECQKALQGDLVIPEILDNQPVIGIGEGAFYEVKGLTAVTLPDTVTEIGAGAFYCCEALQRIDLPEGLTTIGESAFYQCASLKAVDIPDGITTIPDSCFAQCYALNELTLPAALETIEAEAFYASGQNMDALLLPDTLTEVGELAFYGWSRITTVTIPGALQTLGDYVFDGCDGLQEICVASDNPCYTSVEGVLYNQVQTRLIKYPADKQGERYTLPDSVTTVDGWAFVGAKHLKHIDLNNAVTIGEEAFYSCAALETVSMSDAVTELPAAAFTLCSALKEITIPKSCTSIGAYCFTGCTALREVTVPASVTKIGDYAFGFDFDTTTQQVRKLKRFRMNVQVGSEGIAYAKKSDISYRSNSKVGWIVGICVAVAMIAAVIIIVMGHRRNVVRIAAGPDKGKPVAKQNRTNSKNGGK